MFGEIRKRATSGRRFTLSADFGSGAGAQLQSNEDSYASWAVESGQWGGGSPHQPDSDFVGGAASRKVRPTSCNDENVQRQGAAAQSETEEGIPGAGEAGGFRQRILQRRSVGGG